PARQARPGPPAGDAARLRLQARDRRRAPSRRLAPVRPGVAVSARRPVIAVSIGCPSGVGPEVAVAGAARSPAARCVLGGDEAVIRRAAALRRVSAKRLVPVDFFGARGLEPGAIGVLATSARLAELPSYGHPSAAAGAAQLAWIDQATELVRAGGAAALV